MHREVNKPSFPEILWVILIESQKLQNWPAFPNISPMEKWWASPCMLIHSRKCFGGSGVGERGRERGEAEIGSGTRVRGEGRGAAQGSTTRVSLFSLAKLSLPSNRSFPALCYLTRLNIIMNVASKYNTAVSSINIIFLELRQYDVTVKRTILSWLRTPGENKNRTQKCSPTSPYTLLSPLRQLDLIAVKIKTQLYLPLLCL